MIISPGTQDITKFTVENKWHINTDLYQNENVEGMRSSAMALQQQPGEEAFYSLSAGKWPGGNIPYVIHNDLFAKTNSATCYQITSAIEEFNRVTQEKGINVRFQKRKEQKSYVEFVIGNVFSSQVGKTKGKQQIKITKAATKRDVLHVIAHTLGFLNETQRPDRDKVFPNIINSEENEKQLDGEPVGELPDINSVTVRGNPGFSEIDLQAALQIYGPLVVNRTPLPQGYYVSSNVMKYSFYSTLVIAGIASLVLVFARNYRK